MAKSNHNTAGAGSVVRSNEESILLRSILDHFLHSEKVRLHRNHIGFDERACVNYGHGKGSADLMGVTQKGKVVGIEVKSAEGKLSSDQEFWHKWAPTWGVQVCVVRTLQEAIEFVEGVE